MNHSKTAIRRLLLALGLSFTATGLTAAEKSIDVTKAGVLGDGTTLNTALIQKAIDDCSASGGGTISFPAGRYLTGTVQIRSNVTLRIEKDATLLGSTRVADYRNLDPFIDGSGNPLGHALIVALDAENVGIEGSGTVDGQSPALKKNQKSYEMRPFLLRWVRCKNVTVRDIHLTNPGAWTLNFYQTIGAVIEGVTIRSRDLGMHNNDGINIDSSENLRIRDCDVVSGDDALVIKATSAAKPSRDISATNCNLSTRTNAIKLGTESIGGFENITISNCRITNTKMSGIALYAVDGGDLRNVTISDVTMDGVVVPISIRLGARLTTFREGDKPKPAPGKLRDVTIKNVSARNIGMVGMLINGVPDHPVEALTLENIQLELPGGGTAKDAQVKLGEKEKAYPEFDMFGKTMPASAIYARHVRGVKFDNIRTTLLNPDARPTTILIDAEDVTPTDFASHESIAAAGPAPQGKRIILVGDSTVASGSGWGDAFSKLLAPGVECRNLALKGRSSKSYRAEGHWQEVLNAKPDWVLIQFGHNDQPGKGPKLETDAQTTFRENLIRYITELRAIGAKPVLVTSLTRRDFDEQGKIRPDLLVPYVEATKAVAADQKVPLIDLNARSVEQMNQLGPEAAVAFDAQSKDPTKPDKTHLSAKGAAKTADLVAEEIRKKIPELAGILHP